MVSLVDFVGVWPQPSPTWDNDGQRSKALFLAHKLLLLAGIAFLYAQVANNLIAEQIVGTQPRKQQRRKRLLMRRIHHWKLSIGQSGSLVGTSLFPTARKRAGRRRHYRDDGGVEVGLRMVRQARAIRKSDSYQADATMVAEPAEWSMAASTKKVRTVW